MQVFAYRAIDAQGQMVEGQMAAEGPAAIFEYVNGHDLTLLDLKEESSKKTSRRAARSRHSQAELIDFSRSMGSLLQAGLPLMQILEDLEDQAVDRGWRDLIRGVRLQVAGGSGVSEALAAHENVFSEVYVSLVSAGEHSGDLAGVFVRLTDYLEWDRKIRQEVRQALTYPAVVLSAVLALIAILTFFVFPRLGGVLETLDVELPLPTRIMLGIGDYGAQWWPFILGSLIAGGALFAHLRRKTRFKRIMGRVGLKVPILGRLLEMVALARLATALSSLLAAGVQLIRAMTLVERVVGNPVMTSNVRRARDLIESGTTLGESLALSGGFPKLFIRMVRVGEASGNLEGMLERCASYYEREIPILIQKLLGAFGPAMVVFLAATVGVAALSVFLPLLQIGTAIK